HGNGGGCYRYCRRRNGCEGGWWYRRCRRQKRWADGSQAGAGGWRGGRKEGNLTTEGKDSGNRDQSHKPGRKPASRAGTGSRKDTWPVDQRRGGIQKPVF